MTIRGLDRGQKAALVISECQNGMVDPNYGRSGLPDQAQARGILDKIAAVADAFRAVHMPVLHSIIVPGPNYEGLSPKCVLMAGVRKRGVIREGSPAAEIHPKVAPKPGDIIIRRYGGLTPWGRSEFDGILRAEGVQTLVCVGVSSNVAMMGLGIDAANYEYEVVYPEDCIAGAWPEAHEFMVTHALPLLGSITTSSDVIAVLQGVA